MEALLSGTWRQTFCHGAVQRELGCQSGVRAPALHFSGPGRLKVESVERLHASANDTEFETIGLSGSLVQQTLGGLVEPFSRPTQLLTSQEVLSLLSILFYR